MNRLVQLIVLALFMIAAVAGYFFFDLFGRPGLFLPEHPSNLDAYMESRREALELPGVSAVVVNGDGLLWEGYYGTADGEQAVDEDTLFMVASISKLVVGTAVMQQWEAGKFALDDDVNDYLDFEIRHPDYPAAPITIKDLMIHHSAINDRDPLYDEMYTLDAGGDSPWELADFMEAYFERDGQFYSPDNFLDQQPGEAFSYSNYGNALLAVLVEEVSGQPFNKYAQEQIFAPLGMNSSYYLLSEMPEEAMENLATPYLNGSPLLHYNFPDYPAGSLRTTARDFGKFASFYLDPAGAENQILQPETVEMMLSIQGDSTDISEESMGLTWVHFDWIVFDAVGHNGGDFGAFTYILMYPEEEHATIIFTNDSPDSLLIYRGMIERLREEGRNRS
ncbi:MAG: serine hydrolase domain-containing protein [Chloroflexota bacterium]